MPKMIVKSGRNILESFTPLEKDTQKVEKEKLHKMQAKRMLHMTYLKIIT